MNIDKPNIKQISELRELWMQAFGDSAEFLDGFFATVFDVDRCRVAAVDGKIAAMLYWFECSCMGRRVAYIYAVATDERHRGKGVCRQLMEDTHEHLKAAGFESTVLVPGSKRLFEYYGKLGYEICSYIDEFTCDADAGSDIDIRKIGKNEYRDLRRRYLPIDGVVQENENLDFLETQAEFYTGQDFLLTVYPDGDCLTGVELLGNVESAGRIVGALGYKKGRFRTVGDDRPFAMYLPLVRDGVKPMYFGLAFD